MRLSLSGPKMCLWAIPRAVADDVQNAWQIEPPLSSSRLPPGPKHSNLFPLLNLQSTIEFRCPVFMSDKRGLEFKELLK